MGLPLSPNIECSLFSSSQFNCSLQLAGAAVQICGSGLDAAMAGQSFEDVNCSALVGQ
jgi:hypothetical protein